ncbi:Uncharacterized protein APZ42_022086 [Daphnia magna]|uniref:Uncharacterized protein n=1 Tax=Daphnia magna TaxID=35525 RepID=A0A164W024_9CRUS|nr:Uncharacterized protein APZ42_022086 [Daphnia magna]
MKQKIKPVKKKRLFPFVLLSCSIYTHRWSNIHSSVYNLVSTGFPICVSGCC